MRSTVSSICFRIAVIVVFLGGVTCRLQAQTLRPVTSAWSLEAGSVKLANTYLSPLRYSGWHTAFDYERWQAMRFSPESWVMRLDLRVELQRALSPARNSVMWGLDFQGSWSMMWRRTNVGVSGLTLGVGPRADLDLGVLYLPRNGNNPAQAEGSVTVGASAYAIYSIRVGRLPVVLRYQPSMPLIGAFFCPDYGELYYEIALGNRSGLVHCAWPGSYRRFNSLLTVDLRFGATALRLGYRADLLSSKANGIVNRMISHSFSLGVSGEWMMFNPRKPLSDKAEIIAAYY